MVRFRSDTDGRLENEDRERKTLEGSPTWRGGVNLKFRKLAQIFLGEE
jgi:hypothetical protein